jgi:hypothetical protein
MVENQSSLFSTSNPVPGDDNCALSQTAHLLSIAIFISPMTKPFQ